MANGKETVINYIDNFAKNDSVMAEKLTTQPLKTMDKMWKYIEEEARKVAKDGCACIEDDHVYQWARHYWLDYEEKEEKVSKKASKKEKLEELEEPEEKKEPVKVEKKKKEKDDGQLSLFDF